jgi:hypothetical protein
MDSKQIFMIVTIIAALSSAMITTPVMAQNMTDNMTSSNSTQGASVENTTGKISDNDGYWVGTTIEKNPE